MYSPKIWLGILSSYKKNLLNSFRNIPIVEMSSYHPLPITSTGFVNKDRLFFTNLPHKKREKRVKVKVGRLPSGSLIIQCKNEKLNHYSGMHYGKFDVIPLASKGWYHRKSKKDYFKILPYKQNPVFITKEDLPETFEEIGVREKIIQQLKKVNVTYPTVIQSKSIRSILEGRNVFISSECGSGKTLSYLIAMIEHVSKFKEGIESHSYNSPFAIILLPTKELALQVGQLADTLCSDLGVICQTLTGGDINQLLQNPQRKLIDILICTPLVIKKHLNANLYSTELCRHVIIDEADTLTEDDFLNQINGFIKSSKLNFSGLYDPDVLDKCTQICFISATAPKDIESKFRELIQSHDITTVSTPNLHKTICHIPQVFLRVSKVDRATELLKFAKEAVRNKIPTLIFCNKTNTSNWVSLFLSENGINCPKINQTSSPAERFRYFREFQEGLINLVSCTDLASRGLHFEKVRRILNFEFPSFMADYIHRCGRVGRLGQADDCLIMNFISGKEDLPILHKIEMAVRTNTPLTGIFSNRRKKLRFIKK